MAITPVDRKRFEEMGEAYLRLIMTTSGGFDSPSGDPAREWLAERAEAARERTEALQAEQTRFNKSTVRAAWIAAYASIGAIVVGVIGIIVAILLWMYPR